MLPTHPVITVAVGVAATGRTKAAVGNAIEQLERDGVLARRAIARGRPTGYWT